MERVMSEPESYGGTSIVRLAIIALLCVAAGAFGLFDATMITDMVRWSA
jgi:hypothetical protein